MSRTNSVIMWEAFHQFRTNPDLVKDGSSFPLQALEITYPTYIKIVLDFSGYYCHFLPFVSSFLLERDCHKGYGLSWRLWSRWIKTLTVSEIIRFDRNDEQAVRNFLFLSEGRMNSQELYLNVECCIADDSR